MILKDAADYAKENQKDATHSIRVARILVKNGVTDLTTRAAALLHESITDGTGKISEIKSFFSDDIASLVFTLSKIQKIGLSESSPQNIAKIRKIIMALAADSRVFVIKMACRLDNLRMVKELPVEKRVALAKQALEIDALLADSASLKQICSEMQNIAFKIVEPEKYKELSREIAQRKMDMEQDLNSAKNKLELLLHEQGLKAEISFRQKSLYSVHLKILKKLKLLKLPKYSISAIFDLLGLRVVVSTKKECYTVLDIIHKNWVPIMDEFDDYIASPKPNGYQSIHTIIKLPRGNSCEVQIRTKDMDYYNTYGSASHLGYKVGAKNLTESDAILRKKLNFIFVFTPKNDIVELPDGATPIDFAYAIHTDLGDSADKAIINGKIEKLSYILQNGDEVKILTTNRKTPRRRHHIRSSQP